MENLKENEVTQIVVSEFKSNLAYYFKNNSDFAKYRASAYKDLLLKVGFTEDEIAKMVEEIRGESK